MQRGSDKHGPLRDEELASELSALTQGSHESHTEEFREQESPGDDQPEADVAPDTDLMGDPPPGMSQRDVSVRSDLAKRLGRDVYPADRDALLRRLASVNAPEPLVDLVRGLPAGRRYANLREVSEALGLHSESHRF
ncbi:MAG TPA: DUF2795 domain-containing protein [Mycobacteriales bacterium]|jgi:Protein of unknown function (DUF2795).